MTGIILAAGYGTRLYPLTLDKPKAFLEVGGESILDRLIRKIEQLERLRKIIIVTNEKFFKDFKEWQVGRDFRAKVEVINDGTDSNKTRLGAIGDINLVLEKDKTDDDLIITASDNLFEENLTAFREFAEAKKPFNSIALFDIGDKKLGTKYGICLLDKNYRVIDFEEKPLQPKGTLAAAALYFIPKEKIPRIFEYVKTGLTKDAPGNLMKWLAKVDKVFGYALKGAWYDIGDKESLEKADEEFKRRIERR